MDALCLAYEGARMGVPGIRGRAHHGRSGHSPLLPAVGYVPDRTIRLPTSSLSGVSQIWGLCSGRVPSPPFVRGDTPPSESPRHTHTYTPSRKLRQGEEARRACFPMREGSAGLWLCRGYSSRAPCSFDVPFHTVTRERVAGGGAHRRGSGCQSADGKKETRGLSPSPLTVFFPSWFYMAVAIGDPRFEYLATHGERCEPHRGEHRPPPPAGFWKV